jgi:hypothetical protein
MSSSNSCHHTSNSNTSPKDRWEWDPVSLIKILMPKTSKFWLPRMSVV